MRIDYISPSTLPSRSANSVHVVRMCEALCELGHELRLFAKRSSPEVSSLREQVERHYGVRLAGCTIRSYFGQTERAAVFMIALQAVAAFLGDLLRARRPDIIISRNLYAAAAYRILAPSRLVFETHQLEFGFRKALQRWVMESSHVRVVVISEALRRFLDEHHATSFLRVMVLPDGAPAHIERPDEATLAQRRQALLGAEGAQFAFRAGYFGHLYRGRGIEVIEGLAALHGDVAFFVYGGNDEDVEALRSRNLPPNLFVKGFVAPGRVMDLMQVMNVLLMPYQRQVLIDQDIRKDTSRWMSPLKMFEYMATGVPLIGSRLPALQEVLRDGENCLLAEPEDVAEWSRCLRRLQEEADLGARLGGRARADYLAEYNWLARSRRILEGLRR
jgi:glycosyltransferase involved in cell wall biosynthesis